MNEPKPIEALLYSLECPRHDCQATHARVAELEAALRLTLRAVELAGWEGDYAAVEARKALRLSANHDGDAPCMR